MVKRSLQFILLLMIVFKFNSNTLAAPLVYAHKGYHNIYTAEYYKNSKKTTGQSNCLGQVRENNQAPRDFSVESIQKAFDMGADYVEVDTRITKDNVIILFHDMFLDCLTNLKGKVSDYDFSYLKENLAINHSVYFRDHLLPLEQRPFYDQGKGSILSLEELFIKFPDKKFLLNPKEKSSHEIKLYAELLQKYPKIIIDIWGPKKLYVELKKKYQNIGRFIENHWQTEMCLKDFRTYYPWFGWLGYFPKSCKNITISLSPESIENLYGWPDTIIESFHEHKSQVYFFHKDRKSKEYINKILKSGIDGIIVSDLKYFMDNHFAEIKQERGL